MSPVGNLQEILAGSISLCVFARGPFLRFWTVVGSAMANTTYYVALPFLPSEDGPAPGEAVECQSPGMAKRTAEAMSRQEKHVGAVAFQRTGDPDAGEFGDAEIIARYGDTPEDLSEL